MPFFGQLGLSEITAGKIQDYRIHRHEEAVAKRGKPPAPNTMHQEMVALRQTLKTAMARPSSRSVRAVQTIPENLTPGVVLSRGI